MMMAAIVLVGLPVAPAIAEDATLSDLMAPQRDFSGLPTAALAEAAGRIMDVVVGNGALFAGGSYAPDYSYIEVFHTGTASVASALVEDAGVDADTFRLTGVENSAEDLAADMVQIRQAAEGAGVAWTMMTPNFLVDGVDVGIPAARSHAQVQEIFDLLGPLGMKRLGVVAQGDLYDGSGGDVYSAPGIRHVNGRQWLTTCEPYSVGQRCRTEIWATTVKQVDGQFVQTNDWVFNNLTYTGITRAKWGTNPLGNTGSWTADDGREWRTECDTAVSGGNGCRTWAKASLITSDVVNGQRIFRWTNDWVVNNLVRFGNTEPGQPVSGPVVYGG